MPQRVTRGAVKERSVEIPCGDVEIHGDLTVPATPKGVVLFAHGSGSGRHSPRNRFVAEALNEAGLATLLLDLLTEEEERIDALTREHRFDIRLLAGRVCDAIDWLSAQAETRSLPVGLFGASTGAGAALLAAGERSSEVGAVVSRGGRPDLAADALPSVRAPTLLIVGGLDDAVMRLNRQAKAGMTAKAELKVVPDASHLFEEPGTLELVVDSAREWFERHLQSEVEI